MIRKREMTFIRILNEKTHAIRFLFVSSGSVSSSYNMAGRASLSRLFVPTSKDASATAKAASHQLLLRAGFIRQVCQNVNCIQS
jgi:hypothetical protein